jgi:hypothetical protein
VKWGFFLAQARYFRLMPIARTSVFISYSHADSSWLRLLNTHLKPLTRDQKVEIWSDQKIRKGERWRDRIHKQLAMARVGIFLVSADFLASDFIHAQELPPLLKAAEKEGATLLNYHCAAVRWGISRFAPKSIAGNEWPARAALGHE